MDDATYFWDHGFLLARGLLQPSECETFRAEALTHRDHTGDLLSHPTLWRVVLDPRLLAKVRELLGDTPVYFGDSSVTFGVHGRGYHKDNADRYDPNAPDWQGSYPILRCGIYLQDHRHHSGGLNVRDGSHQHHDVGRGATRYMNTGLGDVVFWNLRTSHSANGVQLRGLPSLPVAPRAVRWLPSALFRDAGPERVALFATFGARGPHLQRYVTYLHTRRYMVDAWRASQPSAEALAASEAADWEFDHVGATLQANDDVGQNVEYVQLPYV